MKFERLNFADKSEREYFDQRVLSDEHSFVQQTTKWAESIKDIHGDEPVFCFVEDEDLFLGASLYLFRTEFGNILTSNVQAPTLGTLAYEGDPSRRQEAYDHLLSEVVQFARAQDCVTVSVLSNPFHDEETVLKDAFEPDCGIESFVQTITIDEWFDEEGNVTFEDYNRRTNLSRNVSDARDNGFDVEVSSSMADLEQWYEEIHAARIEELGGTPLPKPMFVNAFEIMADQTLFLVARKDGDLVGGDFCVYDEGGILENVMLSSRSEYFEEGVNFVLIDELLRWCFRNDIRLYDWQSSNPPRGGVYRFKEQWGSDERPFDHYTRILDREAFRDIQSTDRDEVLSAFENHFLAPYHTLVNDEYTIETKEYVSNVTD